MVICDKCKQPLDSKLYTFGQWIVDRDLCPSWDLCEPCAKLVLEHIEQFIGVKGLCRRKTG